MHGQPAGGLKRQAALFTNETGENVLPDTGLHRDTVERLVGCLEGGAEDAGEIIRRRLGRLGLGSGAQAEVSRGMYAVYQTSAK